MKNIYRVNYLPILTVIIFFSCNPPTDTLLLPSDKQIPNIIDGVKYETGNWGHPDYAKPFESFGNHRFVVKIHEPGVA